MASFSYRPCLPHGPGISRGGRLIVLQMISKEQLPIGTKVIHEGEEIDLEYRPDRMTVVVGDDDMIRQVFRG